MIEGYKSAAEEFSQEARLTPPVDFESIESRMDIREALQRGDVEDAITRVNDLNPEVGILRRTGDRIKLTFLVTDIGHEPGVIFQIATTKVHRVHSARAG